MGRRGVQRLTRTVGAGLALGLLACWALPVVATELPAMRAEASEDDARDMVVKGYIQSCQGQAKNDAACEKVRQKAVAVLEEDLLTLGSTADPGHLPMLARVLRSDEAELRVAAADAMGMIRPTGAEVPALIDVLNDSVPAVRGAALLALNAIIDPNETIEALRIVRRARPDQGRGMAPELVPDARQLGVPVYTRATFLHFASDLGKGKAVFTTPDPMPTVLKFYTARAKQAPMTAEQFDQAYSRKSEDDPAAAMRMAMEMQARMMQAMREGKSPEEMQAEVLKQVAGMATELPIGEYSDEKLYGAPMFVVLEESALKKPARFVVVFEDRVLKRTGFVHHLPPASPTSVPTVPKAR